MESRDVYEAVMDEFRQQERKHGHDAEEAINQLSNHDLLERISEAVENRLARLEINPEASEEGSPSPG